VQYNNCGGDRMVLYAANLGSTLYGDLSKQKLIDLNHALMGASGAATIRFLTRDFPRIRFIARRNGRWRVLPARGL
jgi:hypothetical protein